MHPASYFHGWYFKCSTGNQTVALIPAYHIHDRQKTASLQVITDEAALQIPLTSLTYTERPLAVSIQTNAGTGWFSSKGIVLNLADTCPALRGCLRFSSVSPLRYDIMGPFSLVPFLQCRHRVYSMQHHIQGDLTVGEQRFLFQNGVGYLEGDRGTSFPKRYLWTQCALEQGSLMLSVADIPLAGFCFPGIIGIVRLQNKSYRFATYLGARIRHLSNQLHPTITVEQGNYRLTARLLETNAHPLLAPQGGLMCRTIHESASCKAFYRFSYGETVLGEWLSDRASFEWEYGTERCAKKDAALGYPP